MNNKKKIGIDMMLNILATAVPTVVLQLIILPFVSGRMDDDKYGLLVTLLALLNVVPSTFGNALNNIRLIFSSKLTIDKDNKDYNAILFIMSIINIAIVIAVTIYYDKNITIVSLLLIVLASVLWLAREYFIVAFRIKISYWHIVLSNVMLVAGYIVGLGLFILTNYWQMIYILGNLLSVGYICIKSSIWRESFRLSNQFKKISVQTLMLIISNCLTRITTYADKLLIFPILGGSLVSVYYASTLFGKIVSLAITPISSVMLTYLAKEKSKNSKSFGKMLAMSSVVCIVGYFVCILISRPVLKLVYPQFVDDAMRYIYVTTGTMVVTALISVVNPYVLKFFDMKWQIVINGAYAILYIVLSMALLAVNGLDGFCIGALISTIVKLLIMLMIYYGKNTKIKN